MCIFEGKGPRGLARYGHSRDHRGDRPQVNLAVVTDEAGVPISVSILRGNRADNKTLLGRLKILRRRFGLVEATFAFDGGMSGAVNLESMDRAGLSYVTRLSNATLESLITERPETGPEMGPEMGQMELCDQPRLMEIEHEGKRHILAGGAWRAARDRERREARILKGSALLTKLAATKRKRVNAQKLASTVGRALEKAKAHKYFSYRVEADGRLVWERKESIIAAEIAHDGWYLLHTNLPIESAPKEKILGHYKNLLEVEDAFRELKTYLKVRPVHHHRPDRVVNHIRICFLAYWLSARLGREWGIAGDNREVTRQLRLLQTIRIGHLKYGEPAQRAMMTSIPKDLETTLATHKLTHLFSTVPPWVKPPAYHAVFFGCCVYAGF